MGNIRMRKDVLKIREIKIKLLHDHRYYSIRAEL